MMAEKGSMPSSSSSAPAAGNSSAPNGGGSGPSKGPSPPTASSGNDNHNAALIGKLTAQVKKLTEANSKYKNLLKLSKERIQKQEEELEELRQIAEKYEEEKLQNNNHELSAVSSSLDESWNNGGKDDDYYQITRVWQRVKAPNSSNQNNNYNNNSGGGGGEIWALMEFELIPPETPTPTLSNKPRFRKEWRRFDSEAQLQDSIRRGGEPLTLPPYSLTPDQSLQIQQKARQEVAATTEEFRRFRVKAELARQQADVQIRDLQESLKRTAAQRIGNESSSSLEPRSHAKDGNHRHVHGSSPGPSHHHHNHHNLVDVNQLEQQLREELATQERYWKDAYDTLLAENQALKSSGSEALLASQWRQRYEQCQAEKESVQSKLQQVIQKHSDAVATSDYEAKYRDLKESFRLYRKKAKELFDTTHSGGSGFGAVSSSGEAADPSSSFLLRAAAGGPDHGGSADAKLSYLRNLMVNYLTAEADVKSHMEGAIGMLLEFSSDDVARIQKKRAENESWLFY